MKNHFYILIILLSIIQSCSKDDDLNPHKPIALEEDLSGKIEILHGTNEDYLVYSEVDNSDVNFQEQFSIATHSVLMAINKSSNKPVYFGIPQENETNYSLNAKETALYFALQAIPNIRRKGFRKNINNIKSALYNLREVKELEAAIRTSIIEYGYINYDNIGIEIGNAIDRVINELNFVQTPAFSKAKARAKWDDTYAAGGGFYRIKNVEPTGWEDKIDNTSQIQTLRREFFNNTPALIGVKIEKYNFKTSSISLPFQYGYIGFIEPFYPPNLLSLDGSWDNFLQWAEATNDIFRNGWDGLANTDAYSSSAVFEFEAKPGEKDAFAFVNGYYDYYIDVANITYIMINNLSETDFYNKLAAGDSSPIFGQIDGALINSFIKWLLQSGSSNLPKYLTWFENKQFDLLITDIHQNLSQFLSEQSYEENVNNYVLSGLNDFVDKQFINLAGSIGKSYEFSRELYKMAGFLLVSSSPRFSAIIPIEFGEITQPPYPFQPNPFNESLNNVNNINLSWKVNNIYNQELTYKVYYGTKPDQMHSYVNGITSTNLELTNLSKNSRYYWQVEVINSANKISRGAIWTFDNGIPNFETTTDIIGKWKRKKEVDICSSGNIYDIYNFNTCEQKGEFKINSDGTFVLLEYEEENGVCKETLKDTGNWELNGDILLISSDDEMEMHSSKVFYLKNNILQIGNLYDESEGDFCDDGSRTSQYYIEYERVQ